MASIYDAYYYDTKSQDPANAARFIPTPTQTDYRFGVPNFTIENSLSNYLSQDTSVPVGSSAEAAAASMGTVGQTTTDPYQGITSQEREHPELLGATAAQTPTPQTTTQQTQQELSPEAQSLGISPMAYAQLGTQYGAPTVDAVLKLISGAPTSSIGGDVAGIVSALPSLLNTLIPTLKNPALAGIMNNLAQVGSWGVQNAIDPTGFANQWGGMFGQNAESLTGLDPSLLSPSAQNFVNSMGAGGILSMLGEASGDLPNSDLGGALKTALQAPAFAGSISELLGGPTLASLLGPTLGSTLGVLGMGAGFIVPMIQGLIKTLNPHPGESLSYIGNTTAEDQSKLNVLNLFAKAAGGPDVSTMPLQDLWNYTHGYTPEQAALSSSMMSSSYVDPKSIPDWARTTAGYYPNQYWYQPASRGLFDGDRSWMGQLSNEQRNNQLYDYVPATGIAQGTDTYNKVLEEVDAYNKSLSEQDVLAGKELQLEYSTGLVGALPGTPMYVDVNQAGVASTVPAQTDKNTITGIWTKKTADAWKDRMQVNPSNQWWNYGT